MFRRSIYYTSETTGGKNEIQRSVLPLQKSTKMSSIRTVHHTDRTILQTEGWCYTVPICWSHQIRSSSHELQHRKGGAKIVSFPIWTDKGKAVETVNFILNNQAPSLGGTFSVYYPSWCLGRIKGDFCKPPKETTTWDQKSLKFKIHTTSLKFTAISSTRAAMFTITKKYLESFITLAGVACISVTIPAMDITNTIFKQKPSMIAGEVNCNMS